MLNLDTHILLFLLTDQLLPDEWSVIERETLGISSIVLWEIEKLRRLDRIPFGLESRELRDLIERCRQWPIDLEVAERSTRLDFRSDPADEIIAATSVVYAAPLLTRDSKLRSSKMVPLALV